MTNRFVVLVVLTYAGFLFGESLSVSIEEPRYSLERAGFSADSIVRELSDQGYPFVSVQPKIVGGENRDSAFFVVDSGQFVDSVTVLFVPSEPIPSRLFVRPIGGIEHRYGTDLFDRIPRLLETNKYISFAETGVPQVATVDDTTKMILPVTVKIQRNLFVDGALSWSSGDNRGVIGYLDLDLLNLFRVGESVILSVYGDKELQKASIGVMVPWFLNSPFSLKTSGAAEVLREEYGRLEATLGAGYRLGGTWEAGMSGKYYELSDSSNAKRTFTGISLSLERFRPPFKRAKFDWGTKLSAGSGILHELQSSIPRSDFSVNLDLQIPCNRVIALGGAFDFGAVAVTIPEKLHSTEKVRVGGVNSIRGYNEQQKSYVGVGSVRSELRFYFSEKGSFFLFGDPAVGVPVYFSSQDVEYLFGYGGGVRIPAGKVNFTLIWARHCDEGSGPGRIHVGIRN